MFSTFLVPVNGSESAKRAAKYGLELAATYDARVDLPHVIEEGMLSPDVSRTRTGEHGTDVLKEVMELDIDGSPPVETHRAEGTPRTVIAEHVADNDIDLVAVDRHGRTGVGERLLGTTTERVLRSVETPVLTVTGDRIRDETGRSYGDILIPTDGSEVAERAAPYGADLARHTGATVHLLTAVDVEAGGGPFDAGGVSDEFIERLERTGRDALDRLAERIGGSDLDLRSTLVRGSASTEITTYADENDVDLILVASEGETNLVGQYIGSTTRRVLRAVDRPVLVIPTPD